MKYAAGQVLNGRKLLKRVGVRGKDILWMWRCANGHTGTAAARTLAKAIYCPSCRNDIMGGKALAAHSTGRPGDDVGPFTLVSLAFRKSNGEHWLVRCRRCGHSQIRSLRDARARTSKSCTKCAGKLLLGGQLVSVAAAAYLFGIPKGTIIQRRLSQGMSDEDAVGTPVLGERNRMLSQLRDH